MSMSLPKELEPNVSCSSCGHLLSVGPITKSVKGWQCGRCPNEDGEHCTIYESLASGYLFPCKYKKFGCDVLLQFGAKIVEHEDACTKKPYNCPVLPAQRCEWQGQFENIEEHFRNTHKTSVLRELKVEVDLSDLAEKRYFYFLKNRLVFLIDLLFNKEKGLSVELIKVLQSKSEGSALNEKYNVTLDHQTGKSIFTRNLSSYFLNTNTLKVANNTIFDTIFLKCIGVADKKLMMNFDVKLPEPKLSLPSQENSYKEQISLPVIQKSYVRACMNLTNGCEHMDYCDNIKKHESTCIVYNCPEINGQCKHRGILSSIIKHCNAVHASRAISKYTVDIKQIRSSAGVIQSGVFIPEKGSFGTGLGLFRTFLKLDHSKTTEPKMLVVVQYIGEAALAKKFVFSVYFKKEKERSLEVEYECKTMTFPCVPFTNEPMESLFDHSVPFSFEKMKECVVEVTVMKRQR